LKHAWGDSDFQPEHNDDNDNVYVGTTEPPLGFKTEQGRRGRGQGEKAGELLIHFPALPLLSLSIPHT